MSQFIIVRFGFMTLGIRASIKGDMLRTDVAGRVPNFVIGFVAVKTSCSTCAGIAFRF